MAPIRVLLVDDEPMFIAALRALLDPDDRIDVVGSTDNGAHALELADTLHPDVVLIDLALPQMDGFETTRQLLHKQPALRVIAVSGLSEDATPQDARDAGVSDFLLKGGLHAEIADAIVASAQTH